MVGGRGVFPGNIGNPSQFESQTSKRKRQALLDRIERIQAQVWPAKGPPRGKR